MKAAIRKELRARRRQFTAAQHALRSGRAASAVCRIASFRFGARVAAYLPIDAETSTVALLAAARRRGVRIYVPVIADGRGRRLRFCALSGGTKPGRFGIAVPERRGHVLAPRWFALVIVPLVGVDGVGHRLGFGGGFYDRAFAFRRHRLHWRGPRLVGFGFDCQRTPTVHAQVWDLRLDALATESGIILFHGARA